MYDLSFLKNWIYTWTWFEIKEYSTNKLDLFEIIMLKSIFILHELSQIKLIIKNNRKIKNNLLLIIYVVRCYVWNDRDAILYRFCLEIAFIAWNRFIYYRLLFQIQCTIHAWKNMFFFLDQISSNSILSKNRSNVFCVWSIEKKSTTKIDSMNSRI